MADIFVSYTGVDRKWAFWIGIELEKLGHAPHLHDWEIPAGGNIAKWMEERHSAADHVLLVVSRAYLTKDYSSWERHSAQFAAASRRPNFALPVRIEDCELPPLLALIKRCDLFGLSEADARTKLREYLAPPKPEPGAFPGQAQLSVAAKVRSETAAFPGFQIAADAETPAKTVFKDSPEFWCPEMMVLPPGAFFMGSSDDDPDAYDEEKPRHRVHIEYKFALSRNPTTFAQYDYYCERTGGRKPSDEGWGRGDHPVINVSWLDAQAYVKWLSETLKAPYRLPTEAEWEYACRAGTQTRFYCGDELNPKHANYDGQLNRTCPVRSHSANPWGLYGMHGNVWEYVNDVYHKDYSGAPADGASWTDAESAAGSVFRVVRGGSFSYPAKDNRAAVRCNHEETAPDAQHGIRVARSL